MEYLKDVRIRLDEIDREIIRLFTERMKISEEVAKIKSENNLPVFDEKREKEKLSRCCDMVSPEDRAETMEFMQFLMDKSKEKQRKIIEK